MKEVKLIFGDVLVDQTLGIEFEKNLDDFSASITFKDEKTRIGEAAIGSNSNQTAQNYADSLAEFSISADLTITVLRNVVSISYDQNDIEIKFFYGTTITSGTVTEATDVFSLKYWCVLFVAES